MNKLLFTLSLSACIALNLSAQEEEKNDLGEVEVTDTALEAQIKSITSQKLENLQASDIKDILRSMPSVIVNGAARYSQKVYIRGLEDKSSNITIDGARISGQLFHHSGDQTIDAEMLKVGSIELGPNSALSGPGVINGSFTYETKDPSDYLEDGESFGGKVSMGYQSATGKKSLDVAVFTKINDKLEFVGIANLSDAYKQEVPGEDDIKNKESKLKSALGKIIYKPNDDNIFKFSYNKYSDAGDRQLEAEKAENVSAYYSEIIRDTYSLNYNYNPDSELIDFTASVYNSAQELMIEAQNNSTFWTWSSSGDSANEPERHIINESTGIDLKNTSLLDNHKLTYGLSYDKFEQSVEADGARVYTSGTNIGTSEDVNIDGGTETETALYFEDEIYLDNLILTLGARYDSHELGGIYAGKSKQLSPKFKGQYSVTDNLKLRLGYGKIFKGPSLGEAYWLPHGSTSQSTNTSAQTGHNYEVGFDYDLSTTLNADDSIFGFTVYKYNVDNYMHQTKNTTLSNAADAKVMGFESVFRYKKDDLGLSLSHTYTDAELKDLTTLVTSDHLTSNIHTFKFDVDYKVNNELFVNYSAQFVPGDKIKNSWQTKSVERPGYGVHNIATTYSPSSIKDVKLYFAIDNLFDKKYADHAAFGAYWGNPDFGSYELGRNFKVKLSYKF